MALTTPTLSSPGLASGLDVEKFVAQLMAKEALPLQAYDKKIASYQAKVSALGSLSGAIGMFQTSLGGLTNASSFNALSAISGDATVLNASAGAKATSGNYNVNVSQLAQSQILNTSGMASKSASIGVGTATSLFFQFGSTSGNFGVRGNGLPSAMLSNGISNGSLTINGTAIATSSTTNTAGALAEAINAKSTTTGVTASVENIFATFGNVETGADGTYTLSVGGIEIASQASSVLAGDGVTAASIDAALTGPGAVADALQAAGITFTGSATDGTLEFKSATGASIAIEEAVGGSAGAVTGGAKTEAGSANAGATYVSATSVTLASASGNPITIAGTNPAAAGLTAGSGGSVLGGGFTQDASLPSASILIDSSNNTLEGIRDAINKASIGVQASIINDGSSTPYRLVLTSTKTGANASMKISLNGDGTNPPDPALASLLAYDPAGTQSMQQTSAAQDTKLTVNGIAITSASNEVKDAIQGVTLNVSKVGSSTLNISKDTASVKKNLEGFVKAYNDLNKGLKELTGYNAETEKAGILQGDATAKSIQSQLRRMLGSEIGGLSGSLKNLGQIGVSFDKDGSLTLDSSKLSKAIDSNFADIASLFSAIGTATDTQISFLGSTAATKPGTYGINITNMASQGALTSAAALAPSTTIAANTTWAVTLNDTTPSNSKNIANVTIPAGTYTAQELAKVLQSSINGLSAFSSNGASVSATIDNDGKLLLSSSKYGSASNIALTDVSGTAVADLFGGAVAVAGTDVAGTIGGHPVVGNGQTLTGAAGSPTEGLKIDITGGAIGDRGTISFSQGYAYQLNNLATSFLGAKGLIGSVTEGMNKSIKDIQKQSDKFSEKLDVIEKRYRDEFTRLDVVLAKMQSTQAYLTQQLASLSANS